MKKSRGSPYQKIFQNLLKQFRIDAGIRQSVLAKRLNKPQSFVSKYESGERRLDIIELREVCLATGISLEKFVVEFERLIT
jgi:transcriptional regulator with XRE-family HTH domain